MSSLPQWHEFEQAPGDVEEKGILGYCNPWGQKELDMNQWLNNKDSNEANHLYSENHLEKETITHCNILAWRIPGTEEPDGL